jgi:hypothetical protein
MTTCKSVLVGTVVSTIALTCVVAATPDSKPPCSIGSVTNVADSRSGTPGEVLYTDADLAILKLLATSITPVGKVESATSTSDEGRTVRVSRQSVSIMTAFGAVQTTEVSCEHQGCTDPDCLVEGCDPEGLACTPPKCTQSTSQCGVTTPLGCKKKVTKRSEF